MTRRNATVNRSRCDSQILNSGCNSKELNSKRPIGVKQLTLWRATFSYYLGKTSEKLALSAHFGVAAVSGFGTFFQADAKTFTGCLPIRKARPKPSPIGACVNSSAL